MELVRIGFPGDPAFPGAILRFEQRSRPRPVPRPHVLIKGARDDPDSFELLREIRTAAKKRDAADLMWNAAAKWVRAPEYSQAYADLAATGRGARESFRNVDWPALRARVAAILQGLNDPTDPDARLDAVRRHVEDVIAFLEAPESEREHLSIGRQGLAPGGPRRYIAVSGEDDPPWRPVNVEATNGTTFDHEVRLGQAASITRVILHRAPRRSRNWLLYLHGGGSRAEEAEALARAIQTHPTGERLSVVSLDLPGCGYSERVPGERFGLHPDRPLPPGAEEDGPFPYLEFLDRFVDEVVATFPATANLNQRPRAVCGGSLGGNLSLRAAWKGKVKADLYVAWSPASLWDPLSGDPFKELGPKKALEVAAMPETGDGRARRTYFERTYATQVPPKMKVPAEFWWSEAWPHLEAWVEASRDDREEIYDEHHRRYAWRYSYEQLYFSWQHPEGGIPRRLQIPPERPVFMLGGVADNFDFSNIFDRVMAVGLRTQEMPAVRRVVLLGNTGHSIHDERPRLLAREILGELA